MARLCIRIATIALLALSSSLVAQEPIRDVVPVGASDSFGSLIICVLLLGYICCIGLIAKTFEILLEKGRSRWPIPLVLFAMFTASGWFADRLHVDEVIVALFFSVIPCSAVGLLYLGIVKLAER